MENETVFHKIVRGDIPCHKVWEDDEHLAFLSIYPNTEGVTVVIPKHWEPSYFTRADNAALHKLIDAAKTVAQILDAKLPDVGRTAMVFEGFGVDYLHAKLFPMHGTADMDEWRAIHSPDQEQVYFDRYPGYITTHDASEADHAKLAALAEKLRS